MGVANEMNADWERTNKRQGTRHEERNQMEDGERMNMGERHRESPGRMQKVAGKN